MSKCIWVKIEGSELRASTEEVVGERDTCPFLFTPFHTHLRYTWMRQYRLNSNYSHTYIHVYLDKVFIKLNLNCHYVIILNMSTSNYIQIRIDLHLFREFLKSVLHFVLDLWCMDYPWKTWKWVIYGWFPTCRESQWIVLQLMISNGGKCLKTKIQLKQESQIWRWTPIPGPAKQVSSPTNLRL